jgi:hypothetical protein
MLRRAVMDYIQPVWGCESHTAANAESWLFWSRRTDEFSFAWVCQFLEIDGEKLRGNILDFKQSGKPLHLQGVKRTELANVSTR